MFIDESGTPPKPTKTNVKYFVVGGVIIAETAWHRIRDALMGLKARYRIRGEIKWRYFAPNNDDEANPMRKLEHSKRDKIREELYKLMCSDGGIKSLAAVCSIPAAYGISSCNTQDDIYHLTYKVVSERFQYYLQDVSRVVGRKEFGIIVGDHRGSDDDKRLRGHHQMLVHSSAEHTSRYDNMIESLFLHPSHLSVGIQLADMVAGAVWRKFERGDDRHYNMMEPCLRRSKADVVDGYGIIKVPKYGWV